MGLNWQWKNKIGEITYHQHIDRKDGTADDYDTVIELYEGNAWLIGLYWTEQDGEKYYNLWNFFADKEHMLRCLGLRKGYEECFMPYGAEHMQVRLNQKSRYRKQIGQALLKAYDNITVEFYTEEEEQ